VLDASLGALPVSDAAVHDTSGNLLAATGKARGRVAPTARLDVLANASAPGERGPALPPEGVRVPLVAGGRAVGWLDVWGDASAEKARAGDVLADVARLLVLIVVRPQRGPAPAEPGLPEGSPPE
jgi:hypothetical protein